MNAHRKLAYRRFETDAEFRARLLTLKRVVWTMTHAVHFHGEALDDWAYEHYKAQRRIVWVET